LRAVAVLDLSSRGLTKGRAGNDTNAGNTHAKADRI
jgi:hypothetical protein